MSPKSVGVAMSGGVDSTASALILSRDHHVRGFFMDLGQPDVDITKSRVQNLARGCNTTECSSLEEACASQSDVTCHFVN